MAATLQTSRGLYRLNALGEPERSDADVVLTLTLEREDGIERVSFRCAVAGASVDRNSNSRSADKLLEQLAPWIERQFEQLREAALKSLRSEGKLLQIRFETID